MKIEIQLDLNEVKKQVQDEIVRRVVNMHLDADDIDDWDKRRATKIARHKDIIKNVDWKQVSTETFTDVAKELIADKLIRKDY